MEGDNFSKLDEESEQMMGKLQEWLYSGSAKYDSLRVVNFAQGYRGVVSVRPIQKKERIVFIPRSHLITLDMARADPICVEIIKKKVELVSPKHTLLAVFLMSETTKRGDSRWKHYIDILPKNLSYFPINYAREELEELIGSPFLMQIQERVLDLKMDFDRLYDNSQAFRKQYKFPQFLWARLIVGSRMFGVLIDGIKTNILAPFADMLNHKHPKQTMWNFVQNDQGFAIESLTDIPAGVQVFDSYGKKCNSRYLLNYGFTLPDNLQNQICLKATIDGPFREKKLEMIKKVDGTKILKVSKNMNDNNFYEAMGYLRFKAINEFNQLAVLEKISGIKITNDAYMPSKTPPINMELQIAVWKTLQEICQNNLKDYPTTIEVDEKRLKEETLSENLRNILNIRLGEKLIFKYYIDTCKEVLPTLEKGYVQSLKEIVTRQGRPWAVYVFKTLGIMPHQRRKQVAHLSIELPQDLIPDVGDEQQLQQN